MKSGCISALSALLAIVVIGGVIVGLLNAMFPSLPLNAEAIGEIVSYPAWVVAIIVFIRVYRQEKHMEAAQPKPPENLKPIDYSRLGKSTLPEDKPVDS